MNGISSVTVLLFGSKGISKKMKRKIIAITILVIGCCFLVYPIIGNVINVVKQNSVQTEYNAMVQQLNDETKNQMKTDADEYNRKLASGELQIISTDEDSIDESYDDGSGYSSVMDIGTNAIAFIKIPKIDIELPIYRGTNALTLEKGIGHLRNTSLPVGGENSHCVLTGHTGMPSSTLFTDISKLVEGDLFYIQYLDEIHAYKVDQIKIVEPYDNSDIHIFPGKDYVTLLTCYPYGINSHRLLVRGERVPFNGEITFGADGKIQSVTETEIPMTSDSPESSANEKGGLFDSLMNSSSKVSVYGLNVSLTLIIVIAAAVVILIVAVIITAALKTMRSKNQKGEENREDSQ